MISNILFVIPILCAIYVIYGVWVTEGASRKFHNKLLWTLAALVFSAITALVYSFKRKKNK